MPEARARQVLSLGLAKDEFTGSGHWPHQIYVREAHRMVADLVVTENHLRRPLPTERPIGMGSYSMHSHNVQRHIDKDGLSATRVTFR